MKQKYKMCEKFLGFNCKNTHPSRLLYLKQQLSVSHTTKHINACALLNPSTFSDFSLDACFAKSSALNYLRLIAVTFLLHG